MSSKMIAVTVVAALCCSVAVAQDDAEEIGTVIGIDLGT
jgi:hypothetical protein